MSDCNPTELFGLVSQLLAKPDDASLAERICATVGDTPEALLALAKFARNPQKSKIPELARTELESEVLTSILRATARQRYRRRTGRIAPIQQGQKASVATDELTDDNSCAGWILAQWVSAVVLRKTPVLKRSAVVATMRDDGLSLLEWVAHYRALGFESIFIYSNDNIDGSDKLLRELSRQGVITYIDNQINPETCRNPQRKAFSHALHLLPELWEHEWVFFLDSDEFFVPGPSYGTCVVHLLDDIGKHFPHRLPSAMCFHWRWFVSGVTYTYEPTLLLKRFQHAIPSPSPKSLVRLHDVLSMRELHYPDIVPEGFLIRSDFSTLDLESRYDNAEPSYANGQLNHYWTKSFEEFSIKKARGDAIVGPDNDYARAFDLFFSWNAPETAGNYVPPPPDLVAAVEADVAELMQRPRVAKLVAAIHKKLPAMLARFDSQGGLQSIYEKTREATAADSTG